MLFLQPLYEYIFHHYAAHINHFALIKLILYSLDKTLFYFIIFVIIRRIVEPSSSVFGWASLVCLILLIGGLQLLCIGIVGKYVGRTYMQSKHRPIYIIKEKQ